MLYQNDKVRIRPFEKEDMSEHYRSWFHDPETTRFNSHGLFPYTREQMQAFVAVLEGDYSRIVWAVEAKIPTKYPDGIDMGPWIHVGNASLQSINLVNRSAELAIVIGEAEARGKGVGLQVCRWLLSHAFLKLNLHRVWTGTAKTNTAMNCVCAKLGMVFEGAFEDGMYLHGNYVDVNAWGITRRRYSEKIEAVGKVHGDMMLANEGHEPNPNFITGAEKATEDHQGIE